MKRLSSILLVMFMVNSAIAQNKNLIGLDVRLENCLQSNLSLQNKTIETFKPGSKFLVGLSYGRVLSKRSNIETEFTWRQLENNYSYWAPTGTNYAAMVNFPGKETFLSLPILYTFKTKLLNFSLGPTIEYFIHWKSEQPNNGYTVFTQDQLPGDWFLDKLTFGMMGKIAKSFAANKNILIEPNVYYYRNICFNQSCWGVSIQTKYLF